MDIRRLGLGILFIILFVQPGITPEDKVVFLDVGQGDSILLQDGAQQALIDGGPGTQVLQRLGEEMPRFDRTIEVVIITHPQRDHLEGLLHVLDRYHVGMILLPAVASASLLQEDWLATISRRRIPYRFAWAGQKLAIGDMRFTVLGPFDAPAAQAASKADLNNASVMTRVDYCPTQSEAGSCLSFLLTGDAEKRVESLLVQNVPTQILDVDVIKAGHHGSNSSTHQPLVNAATPSAAVISVGAENRFGHPRSEVLERLANVPIYRTDEVGSIHFWYGQNEWYISCGNKQPLLNQQKSCKKTDIP
jgi:competence protein ComEC